jgi:hypothetical protein
MDGRIQDQVLRNLLVGLQELALRYYLLLRGQYVRKCHDSIRLICQ